MSIIQAVILGAVQGLAEFIPVSSSGHLAIFEYLMDLPEVPVLFDVILHVCTLLVVIAVFRRRIWGMIVSLFRWIAGRKDETDRENLRLIVLVLAATAVTGVVGYFVSRIDLGSRPGIVSLLLAVTGGILILTRGKKGTMGYGEMKIVHALWIGAAQGIGVFPGISRSGITISASTLAGVERERAGEFSFILSIPAILGALVLSLKDAESLSASVGIAPLAAGAVSAIVVGFLSLILLLRIVRGGRLALFSWYLIPAGILGFVYFNFLAG